MGTPWFKFFPRDYLTDSKVRMLSREHRSMLLDLWCYCAQDGQIPAAEESLSRLLGESLVTMRKAMVELRPFFIEANGHLVSPRLQREAKAYEEKCQKLRDNASKGGRPKKADAKPNGFPNGSADDNPRENQKAPEAETEAEAEAEKDKTPFGGSAEQVAPASTPDDSPVVAELPCVGKGPHVWRVTERMISDWEPAFPGLDIRTQVERMRVWLIGNQANRKTHAGMGRFAVSWLSRAQNDCRLATRKPNSRTTSADEAFLIQLDQTGS